MSKEWEHNCQEKNKRNNITKTYIEQDLKEKNCITIFFLVGMEQWKANTNAAQSENVKQ